MREREWGERERKGGKGERESERGREGSEREREREREREPYLVGVVLWVLVHRRQDLGSEIATRYNYISHIIDGNDSINYQCHSH